MKKVLVLEDNSVMRVYLSEIIQSIDVKNEVYCFDNVRDAYQCALEKVVDLFIVDIILDTSRPGDSSGLKFVENIRTINHYEFVPIIFVTSLEDTKLYTYEKLHCFSFIEKPFAADHMKALVEQCFRYPGNIHTTKTLYFRKDGIIHAVEREDIVYVESNNHILSIHTQRGDILNVPYITIKKFLMDVDSDDFVQCSRNTVINKNFILNVDISNRVIQIKETMERIDIGTMYKKRLGEILR